MPLRIEISVLCSRRVPKQLENLLDFIFSYADPLVYNNDFEHDCARVLSSEFLNNDVNLASLLKLESIREDIKNHLLNSSLIKDSCPLLVRAISEDNRNLITLLVPLNQINDVLD